MVKEKGNKKSNLSLRETSEKRRLNGKEVESGREAEKKKKMTVNRGNIEGAGKLG